MEPSEETEDGVGETGGTGVAAEAEKVWEGGESRGWRHLRGTNPITRFRGTR